jgi:hypothetical protein
LVCDFRSDCSDNSDESFCTHLPCRVPSEMECHNKEVCCRVCSHSRLRLEVTSGLYVYSYLPPKKRQIDRLNVSILNVTYRIQHHYTCIR